MSIKENPLASQIDAYKPAVIAAKVEATGIAKANLSASQLLILSILAGTFIAFGALFYTLVVSDSMLGAGPTRLIGGLAFSVGLILVVIAGGELFTGNSLMVVAWLDGKLGIARLMRNWGIVYIGNFIGAILIAVLVILSGMLNTDTLSETAARIAETKLSLTMTEALFRGILCNILVCLAVWMSFAAHSVSGKVMVIVPPIAGFVAIGFEHSVANMYVIPVAMFGGVVPYDLAGFVENLAVVTIGNVLGGGLFVAAAYWAVYLRAGKGGRSDG